jgi:pimeloyl-ACP methyl ester carboxylesterase
MIDVSRDTRREAAAGRPLSFQNRPVPTLAQRHLVRAADADLLDTFLVSAVATVIVIRIFLEATGYPQLGGGGLHIAHVLWGGLGMLVAIVLLLLFPTSTPRLVAAVVGGAGLGAFVDELGKFVTSDNDYFFRPTAAILYVLFVVLFLATREIRRFRSLSQTESLVNAVELAEKLAMGTLTADDRDRALQLLAKADPGEALVAPLRASFLAADPAPVDFARLRWMTSAGGRTYAAIVSSPGFRWTLAAIFILLGVLFLVGVATIVAVLVGSLLGIPDAQAELDETTIASVIQGTASVVAGVLILRGVFALRRSRARAYRAFELAILVDLLLAQPFAFLDVGFGAAVDVFIDLAVLATLRYLQTQERKLQAETAPA